jgi:hypothetical protein
MDEALEKMRVCWGERHLTSAEIQAFETAWHEGRKALVDEAEKELINLIHYSTDPVYQGAIARAIGAVKKLAEVEG